MIDGSPAPRALPLPARWIGALGYLTLYVVESLGRFGRFLGAAVGLVFLPPLKLGRVAGRVYFIGFKSLTIVILTGAFTGMALGLQVFLTLQRVGSEAFVGPAVGIALVRELPGMVGDAVAAALAGRSMSAIGGEPGAGLAELRQMISEAVADAVEQHGKISMLMDIRDFTGVTPGGLYGDAKFGVQDVPDMEKLAVVGSKKWEEVMTNALGWISHGSIRYFEEDQMKEARAWVQTPLETTSKNK